MSDPFGGGFGNWGGTSGYHGNSSGGTLGCGSVVDPSQWSQFGFGNNDAGNSVPYVTRYATGMGEGGGGFGSGNTLLGSGFFQQHRMHTGGNDPSYDSSGINPGGMYTGGNNPAHPLTMQTGGPLFPHKT